MLSLVNALCYLLTALFLIATLWSLLERRQPQPSRVFMNAMNGLHYLAVLTFLLGVVGMVRGELPYAGRFIEYVGLYTLGAVVYMRGLFPGGWVHKILREPPRIASSLVLANGWAFGAMLGFVLRFVQGGI